MQKNMRKNEQAVSPVIGVILMVVITVIIAAILAVFAFGIGGPNKAPQAGLKFQIVGTTTASADLPIIITHSGGDSLILKDEKISAVMASDTTKSVLASTLLYDPASGAPQWQTGTAIQSLAPGGSIAGKIGTTDNMLVSGDIVIVTVLDVPTGQLISSTKVTVQ